jgi:hypothetical protein
MVIEEFVVPAIEPICKSACNKNVINEWPKLCQPYVEDEHETHNDMFHDGTRYVGTTIRPLYIRPVCFTVCSCFQFQCVIVRT